jgi:hypothetical protein
MEAVLAGLVVATVFSVGVLSVFSWFLRDLRKFLEEVGTFWHWLKKWWHLL